MTDNLPTPPPPRPASLWGLTAAPIPADAALPPTADVVVAGAGLTGIATALLLARGGRRVVVLEAREPGAVTTGGTTGKLSLLQGDTLSNVREHAGDGALRAYVAANLAAQEWVRSEAAQDGDILQSVTACTFATTPDGVDALEREAEALVAAGLDAHRIGPDPGTGVGLPMPVSAALVMSEQYRLHPLLLLRLLAERLRDAGGGIVKGCRVEDAQVHRDGVHVTTDQGVVDASALVLATGTPVLDRGLFFAKLEPLRSVVAAYAVDDPSSLPRGVYLSVDAESRSLRTAVDAVGHPLLLVGSESFTPGTEDGSSTPRLAALDEWTAERFDTARRVTWWAAQDYRSVSRLPFAGELPRGEGRIFTATGYNKWGMTNAVASAMSVAGAIIGDPPEWQHELDAARPVLSSAAVAANVRVAGDLMAGWTRAETAESSPDVPGEGQGRIARDGLRPVAEATVDGKTCRVSGVCTHLGGILSWNDGERSWDCPLHGSRFDAEGRLLEGPAVRDLEQLP